MRKMKDSGVEWIGEIPEDWEVSRIAGLYFLRNTKVSDKDFPPLSVTKNGILPQLETAAKTDDHDNRKLVKKGDFVINSRSDRKGSCGISDYDGSVSLINTVLAPMDEMNPKYFNWVFRSTLFAEEFYKWGNGIVDDLWTTNWTRMRNINVPLPGHEQQKKIAECVNRKIASIDSIVETISQEIETLVAYKKSVITEAVTKGLDKETEMKDSGIEWIGEIPKHWSTPIAKYHVDIFNGSDPLEEGEVPVYGSGDAIFKYSKEYKIGPTVLLGRKGTIENPKYIEGKYWNVDTAFDVKTKNTLDLKFYFYLANLFDYKKYITSTALPSMTKENYENMRLPYPSIIEQGEIVAYLDKKMQAIDEVIAIKQNQLSVLDEYKKSLIYEYVTGKREV